MATSEGKDLTIEVKGNFITIPNAVMTVILVGVTAGLFMLLDNPETSFLASVGFALVMMAAKALQVNFSDVLSVLGKDEDDLPADVEPLMAPGQPGLVANVKVEEHGKVRRWLTD